MQVKIGSQWFSSEECPICIDLSYEERELISQMTATTSPYGRFAVFPKGCAMSRYEREIWMRRPGDHHLTPKPAKEEA